MSVRRSDDPSDDKLPALFDDGRRRKRVTASRDDIFGTPTRAGDPRPTTGTPGTPVAPAAPASTRAASRGVAGLFGGSRAELHSQVFEHRPTRRAEYAVPDLFEAPGRDTPTRLERALPDRGDPEAIPAALADASSEHSDTILTPGTLAGLANGIATTPHAGIERDIVSGYDHGSTSRADTETITAHSTAGKQIGAYRVERTLGVGGMGVVYLASHTLIARRVAIKVLQPRYSRSRAVLHRFFTEARAASAIHHPGIVQIFDFGFDEGNAYIVMEYLEGETLKARLRRTKRLPPDVAIRIARQVAVALSAAHEQGILHRDLKPENIYLTPDPELPGGDRVKVLDFGLAKLTREEDGSASITRVGSILGTPRYMAPEQCTGRGDIDPRADIYTLGCTLYHTMCGRPPFPFKSDAELIAAHLYETPEAPHHLEPAVPRAVSRLLLACLDKDRDARPASMREVVRRIDEECLVSGTGDTEQLEVGTATAEVEDSGPPPPEIVVLAGDEAAGASRDMLEPPATSPSFARPLVIAALLLAVIFGVIWFVL